MKKQKMIVVEVSSLVSEVAAVWSLIGLASLSCGGDLYFATCFAVAYAATRHISMVVSEELRRVRQLKREGE